MSPGLLGPILLPNSLVSGRPTTVNINILVSILYILHGVSKCALTIFDSILLHDGGLAECLARILSGLHDIILMQDLKRVLSSRSTRSHDAVVLSPQIVVQPLPMGLPRILDGFVELFLNGLLVLAGEIILRYHSQSQETIRLQVVEGVLPQCI